MLPILIDLSQWRPFGLVLDSFAARVAVFVVVAALAYGGALLWSRVRAGRTWPASRGLRWLAMALSLLAILTAGAGLIWVVGKVHSYGLMMALGFLVAMSVARWLARRAGEEPETMSDIGALALAGGVVGARISYVIEHWRDFFGATPPGIPGRTLGERLFDVVRLTSGGLVFDGGLILAIVLVLGYLLLRRLPVRRYLDILAICAMLGLAFGRVGCLLNGCCYGGLCRDDFALAIRFPYAAKPLVYPHAEGEVYPPDATPSSVYADQAERYEEELSPPPALIIESRHGHHLLRMPNELDTPEALAAARSARSLPVQPAQAYGIINALVLAALLFAIYRLRSREGQTFAMMFVLYPVTRFVLEYIRDDNPDMTLTPAQAKCLILVGVGMVLLIVMNRLPGSSGPIARQRVKAAASGKSSAGRPRRRLREAPGGRAHRGGGTT